MKNIILTTALVILTTFATLGAKTMKSVSKLEKVCKTRNNKNLL